MLTSRKFRRVAKIAAAVLICYILLVHVSFSRKLPGSKDEENVSKNKFMPEEPPGARDPAALLPLDKSVLARADVIKKGDKKIGLPQEPDAVKVVIETDKQPEHLVDKGPVESTHDLMNRVCPSLIPGKPSDRLDTWYTVLIDSKNHKLHVYSAFTDLRDGFVKIMGVANGQGKLFCQIWLEEGGKSVLHVSEAGWNLIPETHGFRFVPYILTCRLPDKMADKEVQQVSMVREKCSEPTHIVPVQTRPEPLAARYNFTVCLTPVNRAYSRLGEFLEYMEVNGMFGADHFIFYDHDIGEKLMPFIESYKQEDKLSVLQWKIPVETTQGPTNEIHYFGQVLALNDCMYRARLNSKFVLFLDLDEVIVPMRHKNWLDLLTELSGGLAVTKTFIFPNVFFREEWKVDTTYSTNPLVNKLQLRTLLYTKREHKTWPHRMRSKYISPADSLLSVGIHFPWMNRNSDHSVSERDGLLFHYRNWEDFSESTYANQTRMFQFADVILSRVQSRLDKAKAFGYKEEI